MKNKLGALFQVSLNTWIRIGAGVALVFVFLLHEGEVTQFRALQQVELWAYDARLRLFMPRTLDPRIVILDIDERSLRAEGQFPWPREKLAAMVRQVFEKHKARVLAFDITFAEPDGTSPLVRLEGLAKGELRDDPQFQAWLERNRAGLDFDRIFAQEIARYPVVLGYFFGATNEKIGVLPPPTLVPSAMGEAHWQFGHHAATGYTANLPIIQSQAAAAGHLYPALDFDGIVRRVPMFMKFGDGFYEAMSLAATRTYLGNAPLKVRVSPPVGGSPAAISTIALGELEVPLDDRMAALVPYRGATGVYRYVSATDVLQGTAPDDALRDKIVIVGTSAPGLLDLRATPVREDFPGVEVHANLISGFLDQKIKYRPDWVLGLHVAMVLLIGIPFALALPRLSAVTSTIAVGGVALVLVAANLWAWGSHRFVVDIAAPLLMLFLLYLLNMAWGFFTEAKSRRLITGLFGTYVPKELVAEMSKNPEEYSMRGETREMTVLFSDVRDFTSISEGLSAESLKDMMNTYLTEMTEVIQHQRGTIDKYIGDAIMAFWGAPLSDPDHAAHGVESALTMHKRIRALDEDFVKRGWPPLAIGVGLNCGAMNVGDMGSKFRRAYTVMGDAVNLSSRLEGLTKEYGVGILVSEYIVKAAPGFVYREVDKVVVKGRTEGVAVFEPIGKTGEVGETTLQEIDRFHKALADYRRQRWEEAEANLKALYHAAPDNKLYKVYMKRVAHFRENTPGPTWNGTWVFTTK